MGFFFDETKPKIATPAKAPRAVKQKVVFSGEQGCKTCPLRPSWPSMQSPVMRPFLPPGADILVVGEAPGEEEDKRGRPFVGPSGRLLRQVVPGIHYDRLAMSNTVRCRPPSNRTPTPEEIYQCGAFLDDDVAAANPTAILALGGIPLRRLLPTLGKGSKHPSTITDICGTWVPAQVSGRVRWVMPMLHPSFVARFGGSRGKAWPFWYAAFKKFFAEVDKLPKPFIHDDINPQSVTVVHNLEDAISFAQQMGPDRAIDVETKMLRPYEKDARLLSASISDGERTLAFAVDHPAQKNSWALSFIKDVIKDGWIAHNIQFELAWLNFFCDVPLDPSRLHCTQVISRIYHNHNRLLSLADQSLVHLGVNVKAIVPVNTEKLADYDLNTVLQYNGLDALGTARLKQKNQAKVAGENYKRLMEAACAVTQMQLTGLTIDLEENERQKTEWVSKRDSAAAKAKKLYEVRQYESTFGEEFNIASGAQVAKALVQFGKVKLPKTTRKGEDGKKEETSNYSTDEAALLKFAENNPLAKCVLDFREANKINSTYIEPPLRDATVRFLDGKLHPCYTTTLTATQRLSSEDQNIQNWPRLFGIRNQVCATKGHILVGFDMGGFEARLIAMASNDRFLSEAILTGYDIHGEWRDAVQQEWSGYFDYWSNKLQIKDEKKLKKELRNRVKAGLVFQSFYGGHPNSVAGSLEAPVSHIENVMADFWKKFSGVRDWQKARNREYETTGGVRTLTDRFRSDLMPGQEPYNSPIQGTAADVINDAMNELASMSREQNDPYLHPRIQIHDDLTFEFPDDERITEYVDIVCNVMGARRYKWQTLPFLVEAKAGYSWAKMEEFYAFTGDYHK